MLLHELFLSQRTLLSYSLLFNVKYGTFDTPFNSIQFCSTQWRQCIKTNMEPWINRENPIYLALQDQCDRFFFVRYSSAILCFSKWRDFRLIRLIRRNDPCMDRITSDVANSCTTGKLGVFQRNSKQLVNIPASDIIYKYFRLTQLLIKSAGANWLLSVANLFLIKEFSSRCLSS